MHDDLYGVGTSVINLSAIVTVTSFNDVISVYHKRDQRLSRLTQVFDTTLFQLVVIGPTYTSFYYVYRACKDKSFKTEKLDRASFSFSLEFTFN